MGLRYRIKVSEVILTVYFKSLNEVLAALYFTACFIVICLISNEFITLMPCFAICILYSIFLKCFKTALFCLPTVVLLVLINPLFNTMGETPLFYVNDNPYTLEALVTGIKAAVMILTLILWFQIAVRCINTERLFHVLSKLFPAISLMLSMIYKSTDDFKLRAKRASVCQKCFIKGNKKRFKRASAVFLSTSQNAFESSVIKGISMTSRGYGNRRKSNVYKVKFRIDDIGVFSLAAAVLAASMFSKGILFAVLFSVLLLIPAVYQIREEVKWHFLKSKI